MNILPAVLPAVIIFSEGVAARLDSTGWYHVNEDGAPAYSERYEFVGGFGNGVARARMDGKWFHIDHDGKPAYKHRFDDVGDFYYGATYAKKGDKVFHILPNGKRAYRHQRYKVLGGFGWDPSGFAYAIVQNARGEHLSIGIDGKRL